MTSQPPSLYVATPCYGGQAHAIFMRSLLALGQACRGRGIALQTDLGGGDALIGRGRAAMMARFLSTPATHLLFIDADMGFEADDVFRLLDADKDVIGGVYPRKHQEAGADVALEMTQSSAEQPIGGMQQVAAVGAGFLLVSRKAAQQMTDGHRHLLAKLADLQNGQAAAAVMAFDSFVDPPSGRYLNDYEAFCRRWRDLGGTVWAHGDMRLRHVGEIVHSA